MFWRENNWFGPKKGAKKRAPYLENKNQDKDQGLTQGFNLLQIIPN
jgi:hypothetical protein